MIRTYGQLTLIDNKWQLQNIPPHVAIRLKQLFPRVPKHQIGTFEFPNDKQHCADLSWFLQRYPMDMTQAQVNTLESGRKGYEAEQSRMEDILRPEYIPSVLNGLKEGQKVRQYQGQAIDLARQKLIKMDSCTFHIDNHEAREAYQLARQWWLDHGVPTGYDREHNCMRCVELPNYNDMVEQCIAQLNHHFSKQGLRGAA